MSSMQGVGRTALLVAACRAEEARKPPEERLVHDPYAEALASRMGAESLSSLEEGDHVWASGKLTNCLALRTRFIDDFVLEEGKKLLQEASFLQLVILGCGMDTRALRLKFETEKDNVKIYELDLPHVIDYKQNLLESIGAITPDVAKRRVVISADLSQFEQWPKRLVEAGFDPTKPSIWIAEGLTMYMKEEAVRGMLTEVRKLCAPGSRILVHFMKYNALEAARYQTARERFANMGAKFEFGTKDSVAFIASFGFIPDAMLDYPKLAKQYKVEHRKGVLEYTDSEFVTAHC